MLILKVTVRKGAAETFAMPNLPKSQLMFFYQLFFPTMFGPKLRTPIRCGRNYRKKIYGFYFHVSHAHFAAES